MEETKNTCRLLEFATYGADGSVGADRAGAFAEGVAVGVVEAWID